MKDQGFALTLQQLADKEARTWYRFSKARACNSPLQDGWRRAYNKAYDEAVLAFESRNDYYGDLD